MNARITKAVKALPSLATWVFLHRSRLHRFRDRHKGQDCFILGNGPSLNKMDLEPLNRFFTFGMNKIFLLFDRSPFRPTYHVAVNPLVIEQSVSEFNAMECPSFLSYRASAPFTCKLRKKAGYFYLYTGMPMHFGGNIQFPISEGFTVTYVALQIAYYMGFDRVFLAGVDHNFQYSGSPNEKQLMTGNDVNHFHPGYFGGKEWHLPDLEGSELAYALARFGFRRDGREIFDATVEGKLQLFPKISYEEALRIAKPSGRSAQ